MRLHLWLVDASPAMRRNPSATVREAIFRFARRRVAGAAETTTSIALLTADMN
jgi:hypothetical protein